jgi:glycosyltransferase involved in cell wall biosynthesis
LPETHRQLTTLLASLEEKGTISKDSRIYFVDDGSGDETWPIICRLAQQGPNVVGIQLSRNCGHQNALLAGLFVAEGDAVVSIDADLQDDIDVIPEMLNRYCEGHDVVYGVRAQRDTDAAFKRGTAALYYKLLSALGVNAIPNHADFRLLSRRALESLRSFKEVNLFLRGLVPMLGFSKTSVYYDRKERLAGETKYPLHRRLSLAIDVVTSFSAVPLRAISALGMIIFFMAIGLTFWALWVRLFTDQVVPGWASSMLPVYFLGGVQLLCLGVVGEYVAKMYLETKGRPRYLIREIISAPHLEKKTRGYDRTSMI